MRVVHVITLIGEDGRFGGPLTVAQGLAAGLRARGHDVELWGGAGPADLRHAGRAGERRFRAWQIPRTAMVGLVAPGLAFALARRARRFDVAHVHACRDLTPILAMAVLALRRRDYVAQTHGMVVRPDDLLKRCLDLVLRPLLRRARLVLALTAEEARRLVDYGVSEDRIEVVPNGLELRPVGAGRAGTDDLPLVLMLGRVHPRKRPLLFVDAAAAARRRGIEARWALAGADDGALAEALRRAEELGDGRPVVEHLGALPPAEARRVLGGAALSLQLAEDEPFSMVLIESMVERTPVVLTPGCHLAGEIEAAGAGLVVEPDAELIADAVGALLADPARGGALVEAGEALVADRFSIEQVVDTVARAYETATATATTR